MISTQKHAAATLPRLLDFAQIYLFVARSRRDDGLVRVEADVVDASIVSRQLVYDAPARCVPDVDEAVCRACRHFTSVGRPSALQQILLEIVLMTYTKESESDV